MTKIQRAAMQQALEFCESVQGGCTDSDDGTVDAITVWCPEVISDLRAALEKDGQPMKKLSQLERGQKFRLHVPGGNPHPLLLTLNTLDGMYSHCTDDDGRVFHLSVWTEVVVDDAA